LENKLKDNDYLNQLIKKEISQLQLDFGDANNVAKTKPKSASKMDDYLKLNKDLLQEIEMDYANANRDKN